MSNTTTAIVIYLSITVLMFLGQVSMGHLNPDGTVFFNNGGNILCQFEANGCANITNGNYDVTGQNPADRLPTTSSSVSPTTGNIFTDTFNTLKNWFLESTGLGYVINILAGPSSFFKAIGLPSEISFILGAMWYAIGLYFLIAFIAGRPD
jgi:hypothetical protein